MWYGSSSTCSLEKRLLLLSMIIVFHLRGNYPVYVIMLIGGYQGSNPLVLLNQVISYPISYPITEPNSVRLNQIVLFGKYELKCIFCFGYRLRQVPIRVSAIVLKRYFSEENSSYDLFIFTILHSIRIRMNFFCFEHVDIKWYQLLPTPL